MWYQHTRPTFADLSMLRFGVTCSCAYPKSFLPHHSAPQILAVRSFAVLFTRGHSPITWIQDTRKAHNNKWYVRMSWKIQKQDCIICGNRGINVRLIIVHFTWGLIIGRGIVRKSKECHNRKVQKGFIRIKLTQCLEGSYHPLYSTSSLTIK